MLLLLLLLLLPSEGIRQRARRFGILRLRDDVIL
jgi:hypothetical protein